MKRLLLCFTQFCVWQAGKLPLCVLHAIGAAVAKAIYRLQPKLSLRLRANIVNSHIAPPEHLDAFIRTNVSETGKSLLETLYIWAHTNQVLQEKMQEVIGWEHVLEAQKAGKGILFLTPHLGCYEITSRYYGMQSPITVMFRPPRKVWLLDLIQRGRQHGHVTLVPATSGGVKALIQALKRGEAIGILPDQAPLEGEGEWAPFFERPAYTMTLASKLATKSGAQVLMAVGERLANAKGFRLHIRPIPDGGIASTALLNQQIETTIRTFPSQYLWWYDRYKSRK